MNHLTRAAGVPASPRRAAGNGARWMADVSVSLHAVLGCFKVARRHARVAAPLSLWLEHSPHPIIFDAARVTRAW